MTKEEALQKRREERRKMRVRQRRRRIFIGGVVLTAMVSGICITCNVQSQKRELAQQKKEAAEQAIQQKKKREAEEQKKLEAGKQTVDKYYTDFLADKGEVVPASTVEEKKFSDWLFENYPEQATEKLLKNTEDGVLTEAEVYEALGESIFVVSDRYHGLLKDSQTAQQYGIFERDGGAENQAEITIAGDLCFAEDGFVLDHYDTVNDLKQCISPEILDITNKSDLFFVNHEYAISDKGAPLDGKYYTFRAKPERMELLKEMGADLASLANNHIYDYGEEAMLDTMNLLQQAEIPYVGGGKNIEEAKRPVYFVVNGIKIGFVAASNAEKIRYTPQAQEESPGILLAYDTAEYNQVIAEASKQCDYLIAYIHWGTEDTNDFNSRQQEWGREFLNSGADIVVGGHPHVLQGMEYVDGKPIIYSLGDFWFNDETKYTGLLKLNIGFDGLKEMSFVPCLQTNYTTQYLKTAEEQTELFEFLEGLSPNVGIDEAGVITENGGAL